MEKELFHTVSENIKGPRIELRNRVLAEHAHSPQILPQTLPKEAKIRNNRRTEGKGGVGEEAGGGERKGEEVNEKDLEPSSLSKKFSFIHWANDYIALNTGSCTRLERQSGALREVLLVKHREN